MIERLEKLDDLVALVELKLLLYYFEILKPIKSWDGFSIQDYKYRSKGCSSTVFPSYLWYWLDLGINQIGCRLVALLTWQPSMMLFGEKVLQLSL